MYTSKRYHVALGKPVQLKVLFQLTSAPFGATKTGVALKLAVTDLLAFMVTETGLVDPLASPLQLLKIKPAFGAAVNWITDPAV